MDPLHQPGIGSRGQPVREDGGVGQILSRRDHVAREALALPVGAGAYDVRSSLLDQSLTSSALKRAKSLTFRVTSASPFA